MKSEYELNRKFSFSFGNGIGYEASWRKFDIVNNIILYEIGVKYRLLKCLSLKGDIILGHLSDSHEAHMNGFYLGLSYKLPTSIISTSYKKK
jgi:hypothetical protein